MTWLHAWPDFLLLWVSPLLTTTQVIVRWGAICEHEYHRQGVTVADSTPVILLSWWERLLLPNLNFNMHPYHHYFPGVAFSRLPLVHQIYQRDGLIDEQAIFRGYCAYYRFLTR